MLGPGTVLNDKYEIIRLLGEGGMGAVYEAKQRNIGRSVALKVLHERFCAHPHAVARFAREARAAGALPHEHLVQVLDFGSHKGTPFIVMEFLSGDTLTERLAKHEKEGLSVRLSVHIVGQVLSALATAHAAGIVHRDVKPGNVFLIERGGKKEFVKLVDFGVSKVFWEHGAEQELTEDGALLGTPAYMAPEQWLGKKDVDHRADLFACGAMLYEMLTGGKPFEAETQGELFLEVVKGIEEPPRPSDIAPGVPPELDAVVLKALRRERSERYQSAREFLEALRSFGAEHIFVTEDAPALGRQGDTSFPPPARTARQIPRRTSDPAQATQQDSTPPEKNSEQRTETDSVGAPYIRNDDTAFAQTIAALPSVPPATNDAADRAASLRVRRGAQSATILLALVLLGTLAISRSRPEPHTESRRPEAPAPNTASQPTTPAVAVAVAPRVEFHTLELPSLPAGATVLVDGEEHTERPVRFPPSSTERRLEVRWSRGARTISLRADRDQTLVLDYASADAGSTATEPNPNRRTQTTTEPTNNSSHRHGGVGEISPTRRF